jgi:hypothetical protein
MTKSARQKRRLGPLYHRRKGGNPDRPFDRQIFVRLLCKKGHGRSSVRQSKRITFLYSFWHMRDVLTSTQIDGPVFIAPPSQSPARLLGFCTTGLEPVFLCLKPSRTPTTAQQKGLGNPCRGLCRPKPAESAGHLNFVAIVSTALCISLIFFVFGQCVFIASLFFCHISVKFRATVAHCVQTNVAPE